MKGVFAGPAASVVVVGLRLAGGYEHLPIGLRAGVIAMGPGIDIVLVYHPAQRLHEQE